MKEPRAVNDSLGQQQRKGKNAMKKKTLAGRIARFVGQTRNLVGTVACPN
jgi:hypothetical protein